MRNSLDDLPKRLRELLALSDADLATQSVPEPGREPRDQAQSARQHEVRLPDKLVLLQRELQGEPMASLAHAALVVLIRREVALPDALVRYFRLWQSHEALLLEKLNLRWLVSAADTLVDHGRSPQEKAMAYATVLFVNTIKLYETERVFSLRLDPKQADHEGPQPHFDMDGVTAFRVAKGDTVGNMFQRKNRLMGDMGLAGKLLDQAMQRVNRLDTVYARFRKFHTSKAHAW